MSGESEGAGGKRHRCDEKESYAVIAEPNDGSRERVIKKRKVVDCGRRCRFVCADSNVRVDTSGI